MRRNQKPLSPKTITEHVRNSLRERLAMETRQSEIFFALIETAGGNPTIKRFMDSLLEQGIRIYDHKRTGDTLSLAVDLCNVHVNVTKQRVAPSQPDLDRALEQVYESIAVLDATIADTSELQRLAQLKAEADKAHAAYRASLEQTSKQLRLAFEWA